MCRYSNRCNEMTDCLFEVGISIYDTFRNIMKYGSKNVIGSGTSFVVIFISICSSSYKNKF